MATIAIRAFHRTYCEFESFDEVEAGSAKPEAAQNTEAEETTEPEPSPDGAPLGEPAEPAIEENEKENAEPGQTETEIAETKPKPAETRSTWKSANMERTSRCGWGGRRPRKRRGTSS